MRTKTFTHTIKYAGLPETYTHNLYLTIDSYQNNDALAVIVMEVNEDGSEEYFDCITVNLWDSGMLGENRAYIDTNNCSWAEKMLKQHKFAKDTGYFGHSGFCTYPIYEFDLKKFSE